MLDGGLVIDGSHDCAHGLQKSSVFIQGLVVIEGAARRVNSASPCDDVPIIRVWELETVDEPP